MDPCVMLPGSWDVAMDLLFQPSGPYLGKGVEAFPQETSGLEFICSSPAGQEALGEILKLWQKFDRSELPVAGFKGLEIARQLKQLLEALHDTGCRRATPTDILHQVSSVCREILKMDSLDNHAYAKIMDNFAVMKYGLEHGRAMSPCNSQGIRFWYTITGKEAAGMAVDDLAEDSWKVGADCPVLGSMDLDVDSVSSGTITAGNLSPIRGDVADENWGAPRPDGLAIVDGTGWIEKHKTHAGARRKTAAPSGGKECANETRGCRCSLLGVFRKLFRWWKKGTK